MPIYPNVTVKLTGRDGNAFNIMKLVKKALVEAKVPAHKVNEFLEEARSGDYDNLVATCLKWVDVK